MSVDEFIFKALVPTNIQQKVKKLPPVRIKKSRRWPRLENLMLASLLTAALLWPYLLVLAPLRETMLTVKMEMCGGKLDFAMAQNNELLWRIDTQPAGEELRQQFVQLGVEEITFPERFPDPKAASLRELSVTNLRTKVAERFDEWIQQPSQCYEPGTVEEILQVGTFASFMASVGFQVGQPGVSSCEAMAKYCDPSSSESRSWLLSSAATWLRFVCPVSCGCRDPEGSPLMKTSHYGCQKACLMESFNFSMTLGTLFYGKAPNFTTGCRDVNATPAWQHFWSNYLTVVSYATGTPYYASQSTVDVVTWAYHVGCPALRLFSADHMGNLFCRGSSWYTPLAWLCPETCGCSGSGNLERDEVCFGYDYCPVTHQSSEQLWSVIRKYDLLKTLMDPDLLFSQ